MNKALELRIKLQTAERQARELKAKGETSKYRNIKAQMRQLNAELFFLESTGLSIR